jgi:hypothetical protein
VEDQGEEDGRVEAVGDEAVGLGLGDRVDLCQVTSRTMSGYWAYPSESLEA